MFLAFPSQSDAHCFSLSLPIILSCSVIAVPSQRIPRCLTQNSPFFGYTAPTSSSKRAFSLYVTKPTGTIITQMKSTYACCKDWGFKVTTSSPAHPLKRMYGLSEANVWQSGGILNQVTHTLAFCSTETPQGQE